MKQRATYPKARSTTVAFMGAFIVVLAMLLTLAGAEKKDGKKLNVTVYPFKAAGASEATAEALTSITTYELGKSNKIRVIREGNLKKVLDKQGLSMSGACDDSECQIEIGKILNSEKFVRGDLARLGKMYVITMEVVDIKSGETEFTARDKRICSEEELIDLILQPIGAVRCFLENGSKKKCALEKDEPPQPLPPPPPPDLQPEQPKVDEPPVGARHTVPKGKGSLYVTTTPKGADVYVDAELKGKTPVEVKALSAGDHDLMVTMKGHAPLTKTVSITANKRTDVVERLSAQKGKLSIKSNPPGAAAYLDGKYIGKTPVELPGVLIGDHSVKFELKDYGSEERSVKVEIGGDSEVAVNLQGLPGKILVASQPEGATVLIDGKEVGTTTYSGQLSSGKHRIRVSKSGYNIKEEEVDITPNRSKQLSWTLEKGQVKPKVEKVYRAPVGKKPRILIMIAELSIKKPGKFIYWWSTNRNSDLGIVETELMVYLNKSGFNCIDPASSSATYNTSSNAEPDTSYTQKVGKAFKADVVIVGKALVTTKAKDQYGFYNSYANINGNVIDVDSGRIINSFSGNGKYAHIEEHESKVRALKKASQNLASFIIEFLNP